VTRPAVVHSWLLGLAAASLLIACSGNIDGEITGTVTQIKPTVCVSAHAGTGRCFDAPSGLSLKSIRLGECVRATFSARGADDSSPRLTSISAEKHPERADDCPATTKG
jgi:hypothetical protein